MANSGAFPHGVLAVYGVGDKSSPVLPGQFLAYSGQFRPIQIERVPLVSTKSAAVGACYAGLGNRF